MKWVSYNCNIPNDAFSIINNKYNKTFYARTEYGGSIHIDYCDPENHKCFIGYDDDEIIKYKYEVLVCDQSRVHWVNCNGIPEFNGVWPVVGGYESNGDELFVSKTEYENSTNFGKSSFKMEGIRFAFNQKECKKDEFQVLVYN